MEGKLNKEQWQGSLQNLAASMVVESARICGRVGFVLGVTGYLGRAWCAFELHGIFDHY